MARVLNSTKLRVIVDGVAIYTTYGAVPTLFGMGRHREATEWAIGQIEESQPCTGFSGRFHDSAPTVDIQVDLL